MKYRSLFFNAVMALCMVSMSAYSVGPRIMEKLGRGLVAVKSGSGYYLSWRLFGPEQGSDIAFNVYKGAAKLNTAPITTSTNYQDNSGGTGDYSVKAVKGGAEEETGAKAMLVLQNNYLEIPMKDAGGKNPKFGCVGDLDGDGEYEYVVDRQSNNTNQLVDAYHRDGRFLWRIDMGPNSTNTSNSSPGAACIGFGHSDNEAVYDIDCDGKGELLLKAGNGTVFGDGKALSASTNKDDAFIVAIDGVTGAEKGKEILVPNDNATLGCMTGHFGICYFDGVHPSLMFKAKWGGTRMMADFAFDFKDNAWSMRWKQLDNPIDTFPNNHQIRCLDINGDGLDEFVNGGYARDGDGKLLWNMHSQGVVHGDRWHIGEFDPDRPGLEGWAIGQAAPTYDCFSYTAADGKILKKIGAGGKDQGRGDCGDLVTTAKGYECWTGSAIHNIADISGAQIGSGTPPSNFRIWWDGDLLSEQLNSNQISKWSGSPSSGFTSVTLASSNMPGGGRAPLYGDMFGDWREEVMLQQGQAIRIYTTTIPTDKRIYCLMHDPEYRNAMCEKGYTQSRFVDFYLGDGMAEPPKPNMTYPGVVATLPGPDTRQTGRVLASSKGATMMIMANKSFTLHGISAQATPTLSVYTCSGELVARGKVSGNNVNLGKQFGLANSMFVVKLDHAGDF